MSRKPNTNSSRPKATGCTQTQLAELAGVSQNTVNRVIHGLPGVGDEMRQHIQSLALKYGYRVNAAARTMRTNKTWQVGVLLLDTPAHHYFPHTGLFELILGVNNGLEASGYVTTLMRLSDVERPDAAENTRVFRERMLDGVIAINLLPPRNLNQIRELAGRCVWLDTNVWEPTGCVRRDEEAAGRVAVEALVKAGHRKIVYPDRWDERWAPPIPGGGPERHYSLWARRRGMAAAAKAAGVELVAIPTKDFPRMDVALWKSVLSEAPGLILTDVYEARRFGVIASKLTRLRWGQDYSVISLDDSADMDWWWEELTRVSFDRLSMGSSAAQVMTAVLDGNSSGAKSRLIRGELIDRKTVRQ